jgi:hypothetical protein
MTNQNEYCVLSMHQPWASLLAYGIKKNETRPKETRWRGTYLIHATNNRNMMNFALKDSFIISILNENDIVNLPLGHIIGAFKVNRCFKILYQDDDGFEIFNKHINRYNIDPIEYKLGDYNDGRYVWEGINHRILEYPIPYVGHQSYYNRFNGDINELNFL